MPSYGSIGDQEEMAETDVACRQVRACRWQGSRAEADGDALSGRIRQDVMKKTKGGRCT